MAVKEGFYAFYYTGKAGSGTLLICFKAGKLVGVDPNGGTISGTYEQTDDGVDADMVFRFGPGELATGQSISAPIDMPTKLKLPAGVFVGEVVRADIGTGPLNVRGVFLTDPL